MTVYDKLAARLHGIVADRTRAIAADRFKVVKANPLVLRQIEGDLVLEEGDPDLEIADAVDTAAPAVGDMVVVHQGADGDWIATGVVKRGNNG